MWGGASDENEDDGGEQDGVEDADRHHPREGFPVREG
jgi:hypothetical protein